MKNGYYIIFATQIYHTATPYIISRQRYIIKNNNKLWYNQLDKLEFGEGGNILSAPLRCPQCHNAEDWKEVPSFGRGIPINNNVRIFAPRGILTVFFKMRDKCGKCGYTAKYSQW